MAVWLPRIGDIAIVGFGWGCTPLWRLVCNLVVLLYLQIRLKEWMATVTRRAFAQFFLMNQWHLFLHQENLQTGTHNHLMTGLLQFTLNEVSLKTTWKAHLVPNAVDWAITDVFCCTLLSSLLHELYWLWFGFWMWFNVPIVTYTLNGIESGWLMNCLPPIVSTHLVCSGQVGVFTPGPFY